MSEPSREWHVRRGSRWDRFVRGYGFQIGIALMAIGAGYLIARL